ncbi:cytochrome P450 [Streptomyces sp. NPDC059467]|uniref:cytochrome P450 n=1 Tax=Streptomyces sp. NPDC059467 TaxID=3346844 RepID=UPI0036C799E2
MGDPADQQALLLQGPRAPHPHPRRIPLARLRLTARRDRGQRSFVDPHTATEVGVPSSNRASAPRRAAELGLPGWAQAGSRGSAAREDLAARPAAGPGPFPETSGQARHRGARAPCGDREAAAHSLSWTLCLLARHPESVGELYREVDTVLAGRPAVWDDLPRLQVTRRVVTESLRVHSPVWISTRVATEDVELAGLALPAGTTVCLSPHLMPMRADCFTDPERFDPDRWRTDGRTPPPRNAFLPFGSGPRKCMGDEFAMAEVMPGLPSIASTRRLTHASDKPVRPIWAATVGPRQLPMRLHRR